MDSVFQHLNPGKTPVGAGASGLKWVRGRCVAWAGPGTPSEDTE